MQKSVKGSVEKGGDVMEIKTESIGATLVVKMNGEIDHHSVGGIRDAIDREFALRNIVNIVMDFDEVTFMDSSGIGMIVGRYKQVSARGGRMMIIRVKPQVDKILEISGLKKILDCSH